MSAWPPIILATVALITAIAKAVFWIVGRVTTALNGIRTAVEGVQHEVAELRADLDKIASTTEANSSGLQDHETRLRDLEKVPERPPAPTPKRARERRRP